jgi:hypothetical protein
VQFDSAAAYVVVNGATTVLAATGQPYLVIGGTTYPATSLPEGAYIIDGQELLPGNVITVSGTTISLANLGTALVVNGVTQYLPGYAPLTIGSETITGNHGTYVIDGMTLVPGGAPVTVHGSTISLLPGGTVVVVNGKTTTLGDTMTTLVAASAVMTSTTSTSSSRGSSSGTTAQATKTKKGVASGMYSSQSRSLALLSGIVALAVPLLSVWC